ncbi:queuosine salvage protein isoform X2 [Eublepharis macularius]|uniref:Queuosine 5'-phosphate N-glycosylase/hydrolase n=1 Tax=Eublepharis macularius TaxID=481883 RepID=A0AA97JSJ8_EUBMA|nr:queuosine salvage protein isoform X2 [Eublepharis macularius]
MNMEAFLNPKDSAKFIMENSQDVYVEEDGVRKVAEMLFDKVLEKDFSVAGWKSSHELNPQVVSEDAVNWVFLVDALNFSFWSEHEDHKCLVKYKGKMYSGYWSLCAAVNRALDEGIPITSASYYATMTLEQVRHVFCSDTDVPMPLLEERHRVLNETGTVLLEKFGGSFLTCVKQSGKSAQKLLQLVVENFPSFRDEATFQGKKVAFYKRAQILVADTWSVLEGKGDGCFSDISSVTIFADYRIPQVLVHLGAMKYSEELMKKLKEGHMFQSGEKQEVEIRGCSIWCCELLCNHLLDLYKKKGENMSEKINAVLLDYYLWDYARDHREDMKGIPFHRVRCIYY